ncbi:PREDICTED: trafficking kinesin-binding protein 1-like [Hipposideros armiger]|uniref:Trafficking kinesin-binding protein 1-like n=1 Tax=Hipposideros armiger TaxID=186990 RepID=A0A8B7QE06_HIPAR|nr:PREDICTED: trafficking kinesin-binding protein 1-like [Hipposideros armiger]
MALLFQVRQPTGAQPLPGPCPGRHIRTNSRDVCNSTDLPEVEIISLLEEQLPHYKLRADTIYGYDHDDWLHTPLLSPDANIDLTTEQIEETLKYFHVCNSTDLPEVEIISLLEEQLPHYKLRADTIYGYDHDDWLHTPLLSPDANIDLTTEQIEETLKYFRK